MTVRKIIQFTENETLLRQTSAEVKKIDKRVCKLIQDLKDTLAHHGGGAGLAAPQIGVHRRVVIVQFGQDTGEMEPPLALVNPEITAAGPLQKDFDGCLSLPDIATWDTLRPNPLTFTTLDEWGQRIERELHGADARLVHHEVDHLDGVLFLDRVESWSQLYRVVKTEAGEQLVSLASLV